METNSTVIFSRAIDWIEETLRSTDGETGLKLVCLHHLYDFLDQKDIIPKTDLIHIETVLKTEEQKYQDARKYMDID